jgi:hypothetical protein
MRPRYTHSKLCPLVALAGPFPVRLLVAAAKGRLAVAPTGSQPSEPYGSRPALEGHAKRAMANKCKFGLALEILDRNTPCIGTMSDSWL